MGKYVAHRSFSDREVVASDKDPVKLVNRCKKMGIEDPVIVYQLPKGVKLCPFCAAYRKEVTWK